ncbi:hepatic lectin-like [Pollicipes pollicipes]|uniref:hepatic lectin-like n=1 Tax=Pollicipes pollicipes TaxID=41117 RepID=UPI001884A386|nr:hepatic lectin-like [Pollicipes pollicipes]XP_037082079.1 hepatic lectin-like [Pollicipes pollicipes]
MPRRAVARWMVPLAVLVCLWECGADRYTAKTLRRYIKEAIAEALLEHRSEFLPPETAPTTSQCGCPKQFMPCAGRCYRRLSPAVTYEQAEQACAQINSHLAVPRTRDENLCAAGLARNRHIWLGITDQLTEGVFVDTFGRSVTEELTQVWSAGQPDNYNGTEDCVEIWPENAFNLGSKFAEWNDKHCSELGYPMCQLA